MSVEFLSDEWFAKRAAEPVFVASTTKPREDTAMK